MKKFILFLCILLVGIGCMGCRFGASSKEPDIVGYILDKHNQSILVASKEAEDFSETNGRDEFYDVISLSDAPDHLERGQLVKVWYKDGVEESYPAGGMVGDLEIVSVEKTEGAKLTETEALKKAIEEEKPNDVAVRSITFGHDKKIWTIEWVNIHFGTSFSTDVPDE